MINLLKFEALLDEIEASAIRLEELSHYHERETQPDYDATFEHLIWLACSSGTCNLTGQGTSECLAASLVPVAADLFSGHI